MSWFEADRPRSEAAATLSGFMGATIAGFVAGIALAAYLTWGRRTVRAAGG